jgi:hypothetical protein
MRLFQRYVKILMAGFVLLFFASCKGGGVAPSLLSASELVSYSITPQTTFVPKGQNIQFKATGTYGDNSTKDISSLVSWTVDDGSVAAISATGLMSNSWAGTSGTKIINVTAAYLGNVKTAKVTIVLATLSSIYVNPGSVTVNPGGAGNVVVLANFSDGSTLDVTSSVTWSSSAAGVATASAGVVSGGALGSATLTATYSAHTANLAVTVSNGASGGGTTLGTGLKGDYYNGINFNTFFGTRLDSTVNFDWGQGVNNLGQPSLFSVRWTGQIRAEKSEVYTFYTQSDDGVRIWVDGVKLIDAWTDHSTREDVAISTVNWTADSLHTVVVEYYENAGYSVIALKWSSPTTAKQVVPQQFLYPAP